MCPIYQNQASLFHDRFQTKKMIVLKCRMVVLLLKYLCRLIAPFACYRHRNTFIIEVELLRDGQDYRVMFGVSAKSTILS